MRNISFALTSAQFLSGTKDVTRRLGWAGLKPGHTLMACRKCMGLKRGETPEKFGLIHVLSASRERLDTITQADVIREGFPGMTPLEFVSMFCKHMDCKSSTVVTRIEFERIMPSVVDRSNS